MKRIFSRFHRQERGQTIIFVAILGSALVGTMGVAVEGGRVFVEYRHLQAAADMAALVGAQKLPCNTTDTSCISTAEAQGCTYATNNGFTGCTAGSTTAPFADVPPQSCSPYDFVDYGNGSTNASCKTASSPPFYDYIEVKLTDNLGTVPIFNIPVTLSAHAIAKHGTASPSDFAFMQLDPSSAASFGGNSTVYITGSAWANGGMSQGGSASVQSCDGGFFGAGSVSGSYGTDANGNPVFAPPGCSGSNSSTPLTASGLPQLSDPYAGSSVPPTQPAGTTFTNCSECSQNGWYYDLDSHTWTQGGDISGGNLELFPGIYGSFGLGNKDTVYFNPGVYTFTGGYDSNHGTMCVYGSPSCNNNSCATSSFSQGTTAADQWEYSCSPYGFWDTSSFSGTRPASLPVTGPNFYDKSTGTSSSTPLNGVTIYIPSGAGTVTGHGNSGKNGSVYLAASNPCAGTGSFSSSSQTVTFPTGSASGVFTYGSNSWNLPHGVTQSSAGVVYPSQDFTLEGECTNSSTLLDWPGEFVKPQHLHFLWYIAGSQSITFNGASAQQWTGIVYAPQSTLSINGAGKGAGGPPWIDGQLIAYDASFSGNSTEDISYRACGATSTPCGSGPGTQLIQ